MCVKLLGVVICAVVVSSFGDECLIRHRICSVKDRSVLQKICKRNGGIHEPMLKYAGPDIIADCCHAEGCTRQYLCDFCENTCCQVAIDTVTS